MTAFNKERIDGLLAKAEELLLDKRGNGFDEDIEISKALSLLVIADQLARGYVYTKDSGVE